LIVPPPEIPFFAALWATINTAMVAVLAAAAMLAIQGFRKLRAGRKV